ncbi:MAG: TonB-dependent receptor [Terracidiphilus sp.]|nr:TonB-dependent receptor [Terracidiphilus sp.]
MHVSSTKIKFVIPLFSVLACFFSAAAQTSTARIVGTVLDPQGQPVATSDKASPSRLSGTIVDTSGAVIAGATVQVRSANGTQQKTAQSDRNGAFIFSGLPAGFYRLVVSNPDFETKEMPVAIGTTGAPAPLRISLAVSAVSTTINVQGREDDLIGIAESGTQGTVGATEIQDRPILRSGEVLETVPGLIITQHAGGGKANQYYLRGFNLDHGTDFAIFIDDMPLNLPSHAHGEGYSDMNTVIPEFVKRVNFEKGPYYADIGNYGSAGSAHVEYFRTLPRNFVKVEGGSYTYGRAVFGVSQKLGSGSLLYGGEAYYDNRPWIHPDAYAKFNGLLTYSQGGDDGGVSVTARAYHGKWHSSDQIPVSAVSLVGLYGTLDPSDGGHSQRYSLQAEGHRQGTNSESKVMAYGFYYDLDLFSNFTYYLVDPIRGDQFEQQDRRWVAGLDAHHTIFSQWLGRKMANTFGLQLRNDWIDNGLYAAENRVRMDKTDYNTGDPVPPTLPATRERDRFTDTIVGVYAENKIQWANKFRSVVALRGDDEKFIVTSLAYSATVNAANSGSANKFLPSPKASLIFGPWANTEFYAQGGFSFHSNDGRGTTQTVEPISADNPYPNTPAAKIPPLVQTKGGEFGVRTVAVPHLQSTLALWYLRSNSELMQDGDTGGTSASEQSSNRYGVEWANYYTPREHLAFDFDLANSRALFTTIDADDAAPNSAGGKRVPEAVGVVISSGVALHDYKGFSSSLRLRYFGPRDLISDGIFRSNRTVMLNGELGYQIKKKWRVSVEFLNMLDRSDSDIDYAYESRVVPGITPGGAPIGPSVFTRVAHPVEPFQVRFALGRSF